MRILIIFQNILAESEKKRKRFYVIIIISRATKVLIHEIKMRILLKHTTNKNDGNDLEYVNDFIKLYSKQENECSYRNNTIYPRHHKFST